MKLRLFATITFLAIHHTCSGSEKSVTIIFHEIMRSGTRMTLFSDDAMFAKFPEGSQVAKLPDKTQILIPSPQDTAVYIENAQGIISTHPINSLPAHLSDPATYFLGSYKFRLLQSKIKVDERAARKSELQKQKVSSIETRLMKKRKNEPNNFN